MKTFQEYLSEELLNEKLIVLNNGKRYGQIVFLAGGAGSGKGFASTNFMQSELYKVRDVDEWKKALMKIADLASNPEKYAKLAKRGSHFDPEKYKEIKGLDLKRPEHVSRLHAFVDKLGIKNNTMNALLAGMKNKETLPNIMFDITAKDINSIQKMMPGLLRAGYNPANIHMIWVLTNYQVAIKNNAGRPRVVPADIMFQTHKGAAHTMFEIIKNKGKKLAVNGQVHVVLNNRDNTIFWEKGDTAKGGQKLTQKAVDNRTTGRWKHDKKDDGTKRVLGVIKDFTYLTMKERGKSYISSPDLMQQLYQWIVDNIPAIQLRKDLEDSEMIEPKLRVHSKKQLTLRPRP